MITPNATPVIISPQISASNRSLHAISVTRRTALKVVAGGVLAAPGLVARQPAEAQALLGWFGGLLEGLIETFGSAVIGTVATDFVHWIEHLSGSERTTVERANNTVAANGFTACNGSPVYGNAAQVTAMYGIAHENMLDGCAPIYSGGICDDPPAIIYGPVVLLLRGVALNWPQGIGVQPIDALLPIADVAPDTACRFDLSSLDWYIGRTAAGLVKVKYDADLQNERGHFHIVSLGNDQTEFINRQYDVILKRTS